MRRLRLRYAYFAEDYRQKIDRYRNGKPIMRLHGPIGQYTIPINRVNRDFVANPKRRKDIANRFNSSPGLTNIFNNGRSPRSIRQTKANPVRVRTLRPVRVRQANGLVHLRMQSVTPIAPVAVKPKLISTIKPRTRGAAALAALTLIGGAAGINYLSTRNN